MFPQEKQILKKLGTKWIPLSLSSLKAPTACHQYASGLRKSKSLPLLSVILEAQGTSILAITQSSFSPQIPRACPFSCFLSATLARKFSLPALANWPLTLPLSIPTAPALIHAIVICLLPLNRFLNDFSASLLPHRPPVFPSYSPSPRGQGQ